MDPDQPLSGAAALESNPAPFVLETRSLSFNHRHLPRLI
jgi:hypothetical protein